MPCIGGCVPADPILRLGPWPLGVDNVHPADHEVFQVPGRGDSPARLLSAVDVDLNDKGWPSGRPLSALDAGLAEGLGGWDLGGRLFVQDGAVLYERVAGVLVARVTGLAARVALAEHAARIFGSDGTTHFEIDGTTVRNWGLPVPAITATVPDDGSSIPAGSYNLKASFQDARGNLGGPCREQVVTLSKAGVIEVDLAVGADSTGATHLLIYVGRDNQPEPSYAASVAIASLPYTLTSVTATAGRPAPARGRRGPFSGLLGIASFRSFLLFWRDNYVWRSDPYEMHLFHPSHRMGFLQPVRAVEALSSGLWIGTDGGLVWVQGDNPSTWLPAQQTSQPIFPGSMCLDAARLPSLQASGRVALFACPDGVLAAMEGGQVAWLTRHRYHLPATCSRASFAWSVRDGIEQIMIAIIE